MNTYYFTVYDGNPAEGHDKWPTHTQKPVLASDLMEAAEKVEAKLARLARGLSESDGYEVGQTLYAVVSSSGGKHTIVTHEIVESDLD